MTNQLRKTSQSETSNEQIHNEPGIPVFGFGAGQNDIEEQTATDPTRALSLLIDEVTSPNSQLSDESFVPSLVELENFSQYSNDDIPIGSEIQIGADFPVAENMNPTVRLTTLKREEIEIELSSFSTPPNSPHSLDDVVHKKKSTRGKTKSTKKKTVSGNDFHIRELLTDVSATANDF